MEGRRGGRRWGDAPTILPLRRTRQLYNTVSCWYCDFKFLALNEPLFHFGRRHSKYLRVWFSVGIGFSLSALLGAMLFILCEVARAGLMYVGNSQLNSPFRWLSFLNAQYHISLSNLGYLCLSSVVSIIVHEFGHALAAASEGLKMEYIAIFLAGLFPGALVAFNHASLLSLPKMASLRIYCAGIWHNAIFCVVCSLALMLLPFILSPFYIHGENPMVLDVPPVSPLSGFLSPHDVIFSLNDFPIHTAEEWKQKLTEFAEQTQLVSYGQSSRLANLGKGYCIPVSLIEKSTHIQYEGNQTYCPGELSAFALASCLEVSKHNDDGDENKQHLTQESIHCLDANDVIKLRKCVYSPGKNQSGCICSQVESCMMPVQLRDQGWAEITYSKLGCPYHRRSLSPEETHSSTGEKGCLQTFVFVGDLISMAHSVHLTSYQPRWSMHLATNIPHQLEKLFTCAFHVSLLVSLLNSLPVYFLDGESILEVTLDSFSTLSSRRKQLVLRCCLLAGTFISTCYILQTVYFAIIAKTPFLGMSYGR